MLDNGAPGSAPPGNPFVTLSGTPSTCFNNSSCWIADDNLSVGSRLVLSVSGNCFSFTAFTNSDFPFAVKLSNLLLTSVIISFVLARGFFSVNTFNLFTCSPTVCKCLPNAESGLTKLEIFSFITLPTADWSRPDLRESTPAFNLDALSLTYLPYVNAFSTAPAVPNPKAPTSPEIPAFNSSTLSLTSSIFDSAFCLISVFDCSSCSSWETWLENSCALFK